jgi:hypothetical protein
LTNMSLHDFANANLQNLRKGMETVYFVELCGALDEAYRAGMHAPSLEDGSLFLKRLFLICDKAFRSAVCLIASGQPEDSVGISRRAIEAARTALAVKVNPANGEKWIAEHKRLERWAARLSKEKPGSSFRVTFQGLENDALANDLGLFLGILSDAYVHFTPEFYSMLSWSETHGSDGNGQMLLNYFHTDWREIERHYIMLGAVHGLILKTFDRCFDGKLIAYDAHREAIERFWRIGKALKDEYDAKYPQTGPEFMAT